MRTGRGGRSRGLGLALVRGWRGASTTHLAFPLLYTASSLSSLLLALLANRDPRLTTSYWLWTLHRG